MKQKIRVKSHWPISPDMHGVRADQFLHRKVGRISRTKAQSIIKAADLLMDGQKVKPSSRVKCGQIATLIRTAPDFEQDIDLFDVGVIYEDADLLVVDKPYGLTLHPNASCLFKCLTQWLKKNYPGKINPCHRIDKETSGLVVCAKSRLLESKIKVSFSRHRVQKTYLAVVDGPLAKKQRIDIPLALAGSNGFVRIKMVPHPDGKPSSTLIRPLHYCPKNNRTLVFCRPLTGRQHQIRVHLAAIGHPIVGDKLYNYGDRFFDDYCKRKISERALIHPRHALHAARLRFRIGEKNYIFKAPMPKDFYRLTSTPSPRTEGISLKADKCCSAASSQSKSAGHEK